MSSRTKEGHSATIERSDVSKSIRIAVKTGAVCFGFESTLEAIKRGKARLVILANNCPESILSRIEYYSKLSQVPILRFGSSSWDLGSTCGKPFMISAMAIKESGDSNIMQIVTGGRRT
nr:50S ribosomal protein L30e [Candidatus Njordarchaeum guaymaensis]